MVHFIVWMLYCTSELTVSYLLLWEHEHQKVSSWKVLLIKDTTSYPDPDRHGSLGVIEMEGRNLLSGNKMIWRCLVPGEASLYWSLIRRKENICHYHAKDCDLFLALEEEWGMFRPAGQLNHEEFRIRTQSGRTLQVTSQESHIVSQTPHFSWSVCPSLLGSNFRGSSPELKE